MAETLTTPEKNKKKKTKRPKGSQEKDDLNSLSWSESLAGGDDPFALFAGGDEGGFLTLEEIDEADYGFISGAPDPVPLRGPKKRKRGCDGDADSGTEGSCVVEAEEEEKKEEDVKTATTKKKKKNKRRDWKKKKMRKEKEKSGDLGKNDEKNGESAEADVDDDDEECPELIPIDDIDNDSLLNEDEVYAWKELRLHPLLIKSIRKLGFREPTPIQKACIPAAAHQGKDVIGAAETGSGKTLAFGLPILQRLLEEREKASRSLQREEKSAEVECGGPLRALVITPTRELALQVCDHLKLAANNIDIRVVPIVGGMSSEKQERLLKRRPEIIVGTPGRLWELMSGGNQHLVELHSLSFFVLDEADRMIENGHFRELQSIIDMLPATENSTEQSPQTSKSCKTIPNLQRKKRQTFVFSATIALSDNFRKKLKRSSSSSKSAFMDGLSSIETLSQRAGMKADAAIIDLTNASIMTNNLEESFIECKEEDKEAYLYYILSIYGQGRTIVFCTSIAALRRISSLLRILGIHVWTLHAQMQQRARLKAIDRFRGNEHAVLIATDVAARGLDIHGVRTVVHYQLPHSAEVYIHRSGRTARASADGCCIAMISPSDKTKFVSLCKSMSKESLRQFPLDDTYMPEVIKRMSLARQIDKILRKSSQEKAKKSWFQRNAESVELAVEDSGSEDETVKGHKLKKNTSIQLKGLQQELNDLLRRPLQPRTFSHRFLAGAGISPLVQKQLEQLSKRKTSDKEYSKEKRAGLMVIGQDCIEPLQALRTSGHEVCVNLDKARETRRVAENLKRKRREEKKRTREQLRKEKKRAKEGTD